MSRVTELDQIRAILNRDRNWCVYALGDLAPELFKHCRWYAVPDGSALVLIYGAYDTPVLLTTGAAAGVAGLLEEAGLEPQLYLAIRPEILPLVQASHTVSQLTNMWRMTLTATDFKPPAPTAVRLTPADLPALERLYADGNESGEAPTFFLPTMVGDGVYFGVWEGPDLVAAAGTHLVTHPESVAAIGNVYTRRDRRGRGLATSTTGAVSAELLRLNLRTITLNVNQTNTPAVKAYQRLGFVNYCAYHEGLATRK